MIYSPKGYEALQCTILHMTSTAIVSQIWSHVENQWKWDVEQRCRSCRLTKIVGTHLKAREFTPFLDKYMSKVLTCKSETQDFLK